MLVEAPGRRLGHVGAHYCPTLPPRLAQLAVGAASRHRSPHLYRNCGRSRRRRTNNTLRCAAAAPAASSLPAAVAALRVPPWQDVSSTFVAVVAGLLLVKTFDSLSHRDLVEKKLSRKLVHMLAGPGFLLCWPLFSAEPTARLFAAIVPMLNIVRLLLIGNGIVQDERTVKSVSRSGDKSELLRGPLYYVVVLLIATLAAWRLSPVPMVALALMCGGDGLADIAGRNIGGPPLPHNPRKTWAGSIAMFLGGTAMALTFIFFFGNLGYFPLANTIVPIVAASAFASTVAESLPISDVLDDNLTVPVVAAVTSLVLLTNA